MDRNNATDRHAGGGDVAVKRPNEVKLAEVKKPAEVLAMSLKDSLKFGILIGQYIYTQNNLSYGCFPLRRVLLFSMVA